MSGLFMACIGPSSHCILTWWTERKISIFLFLNDYDLKGIDLIQPQSPPKDSLSRYSHVEGEELNI